MAEPVLQRDISITGRVQGIGFRPFVYRLASRLNINGFVLNAGGEVSIVAQGQAARLDAFHAGLEQEKPALASFASFSYVESTAEILLDSFTIKPSLTDAARTVCPGQIPADLGVCPDCTKELFDPVDRRYLYPFINCTACGPRYSIIKALPYSRDQTSMREFPLCASCAEEYSSSVNRRYHAEPVSCPDCGPQLRLEDSRGQIHPAAADAVSQADVIAATQQLIKQGSVVAIKGIGGFHLACDASQPKAVRRLRGIKNRWHKPLAIMALNKVSVETFAEVDRAAEHQLESIYRPIVLLPKKRKTISSGLKDDLLPVTLNDTDEALPDADGEDWITPGLMHIAVMLPYTPVHYLLFHATMGHPAGQDWLQQKCPLVLVLTSANHQGEPLITRNEECRSQLADGVEAFLTHNRQILNPCDDSIVKPGTPDIWIRQARGAIQRIDLGRAVPVVLGCGGYLKNTLCVTHHHYAYLSPYTGDLDSAATCERFEQEADRLLKHIKVAPQAVCSDLHPDFWSTRFAEQFQSSSGDPASGADKPVVHYSVQHHQAHALAVLAEHQLADEPVLGLILDGFGLGPDGGLWGGELLHLAGTQCTRLAHLSTLPLPGGDLAAKEPWRIALAALLESGVSSAALHQRLAEYKSIKPGESVRLERFLKLTGMAQMPRTSSAGRWFDLAASLLGINQLNHYEAQSAMRMEALLGQDDAGLAIPVFDSTRQDSLIHADGMLNLFPLIPVLADFTNSVAGARWFHQRLAGALLSWVQHWQKIAGTATVVLAGGCFSNRFLLASLTEQLGRSGCRVLHASQLPGNDSALSLGQAWYGCLKIMHGE